MKLSEYDVKEMQTLLERKEFYKKTIRAASKGKLKTEQTYNGKVFKAGMEIEVVSEEWVEILAPCENQNCSYDYGDNALVKPGVTLTVIGFFNRNGRKKALCKVENLGPVFGSRCPDGALIACDL